MNLRDKVNTLYADTPSAQLPAAFHRTLQNVVDRVGVSGDVFCETMAKWLVYGNGEPMTADEVFNVPPPDLSMEVN